MLHQLLMIVNSFSTYNCLTNSKRYFILNRVLVQQQTGLVWICNGYIISLVSIPISHCPSAMGTILRSCKHTEFITSGINHGGHNYQFNLQ